MRWWRKWVNGGNSRARGFVGGSDHSRVVGWSLVELSLIGGGIWRGGAGSEMSGENKSVEVMCFFPRRDVRYGWT